MSFLTHLECSVPCGAPPRDPREPHHLCSCGMPLLARYDLRRPPRELATREPGGPRADHVAVPRADAARRRRGAGHARRGLHAAAPRARASAATLGLDRLYIKDESLNPTNSFKARGLSAAVTKARTVGARTLSVPSAGNAANAMAAYAACAGLEAKVFMPKDVKVPFIRECELYGADVTLVDGLITDAGRVAAERGGPLGLVRRLHAEGAVPHRRQEDDGLRAGRAARLALARLDHLPHRRRHGHRRHVEGLRGDRDDSAGSRAAGGRGW